MTKSYIKKVFKDKDVQLGKGSIEMIEHELQVQITLIANRCKHGNLKRLTPELFWVAMGKLQ